LEAVLYKKRVQVAETPLWLLVTGQKKGEDIIVQFALKVYGDLTENCETLPPLQMLAAVASRFGLPFRVGPHEFHFILKQEIELEGPGPVPMLQGVNPENHSFVLPGFFRFDKEPKPVARCVLCYCLDTDVYKAWLRQHRT